MKLFRESELIGIITNPKSEGPAIIADLELTEAASNWQDVFDYVMDERSLHEAPPFDENRLEGWFIQDETGQLRPVFVPAIHDGGKNIEWRW